MKVGEVRVLCVNVWELNYGELCDDFDEYYYCLRMKIVCCGCIIGFVGLVIDGRVETGEWEI